MLKHPRQFSTELMEKLLELMRDQKTADKEFTQTLETVTKAMVLLFSHHPSTADQVLFYNNFILVKFFRFLHKVICLNFVNICKQQMRQVQSLLC